MSICNIVVSYYNSHKFLQLLNLFENNFLYSYDAIIYNKSDNKLPLEYHYKQKHLDNVGREGETYLNHIIHNYDNLSEYTIFIQDDTNNHIRNYKHFISFCNNIITNKTMFALYPSTWKAGGDVIKRQIRNGYSELHTIPSSYAIKLCCQEHNINLPCLYTTETCAFFICHKKAILNRKKEFYIKLRNWLLSNYNNGFVLEHVWKLIFIEKNKNRKKK